MQKEVKKENNNSIIRSIMSFLFPIIVAFLLSRFVCTLALVQGLSMYPTLNNADILFTEKISSTYDRFDIVVLKTEDKDREHFIKRIVGLPGETIMIADNGEILIDGEILEEDYGYEIIANAGIASEKITLKDDEYFVLGDNRNNSVDSRFVDIGPISKNKIISKVVFRIKPIFHPTII